MERFGCYLYRTKSGNFLMICSTFSYGEYAIGIAESVTGWGLFCISQTVLPVRREQKFSSWRTVEILWFLIIMNSKMRKVICFLIIACASAGAAQANKTIKIEDYVGGRIESCINNRVKSQDTKQLVEPFRHLTEGTRWQTEFIGKWMLGAV